MSVNVDAEVTLGLRFVAEWLQPRGIKCWATEKEIFGEHEEICGSVDWIGYYADDPDQLIIVDWKRSKKLSTDLVSAYGKRMTKPLQHLHDCDGAKYALQLSCYAFLLEKYYGKRVRALALCCVHTDYPVNTFVPYLRTEVAYLMRKRRERVAAKVRVDFEAPEDFPRCSITGLVLYDGVSVNGTLCNRRDALVRYPDAVMHDAPAETSHVVTALNNVHTETSQEEIALKTCPPWSDLMPADGLSEPPA
jgi:hypothetical protein